MQRTYGVEIRLEEGDHHVYVRDLTEVVTAGKTLDEALEMAADAIGVIVAYKLEDGETVPDPTPVRPGEHAVICPDY